MSDCQESTGEVADDILTKLTLVEEVLGQVERGRRPHHRDVEDAVDQLEEAQKNASEILERYEEEHGPI